VKQARLDSFIDHYTLSEDPNGLDHQVDQEWQRTIGAMLRHDLMNKLMVAKGGLELFDRSGEAKFLDMVRRNLETCGEIVGRISLLENSPGLSDLTPTDVASVARRVMSGHQGRGIDLAVQGQASVMADGTLYHVFDNLVSNSIEHAAPSGICIDMEERNGSVLVRVTDDGIGIPKEARDKLFEEGFKYGPKGNTGLGLFIVRRLVERYGGRIWLDENVFDHTVFCIEMKSVNDVDLAESNA
jgi:signal transduction histidine kinase